MKMIGKLGQPPCGARCCGDTTKSHQRNMKRSERQKVRKEIRLELALYR